MEQIINAQINSTRFGFDEHYHLIFDIKFSNINGWLTMGSYCIGRGSVYVDNESSITGSKKGTESMARIMWAVGADTWENLKGTYCRIKFDESGKVTSIGHILEDKWFNLVEYMKRKDETNDDIIPYHMPRL